MEEKVIEILKSFISLFKKTFQENIDTLCNYDFLSTHSRTILYNITEIILENPIFETNTNFLEENYIIKSYVDSEKKKKFYYRYSTIFDEIILQIFNWDIVSDEYLPFIRDQYDGIATTFDKNKKKQDIINGIHMLNKYIQEIDINSSLIENIVIKSFADINIRCFYFLNGILLTPNVSNFKYNEINYEIKIEKNQITEILDEIGKKYYEEIYEEDKVNDFETCTIISNTTISRVEFEKKKFTNFLNPNYFQDFFKLIGYYDANVKFVAIVDSDLFTIEHFLIFDKNSGNFISTYTIKKLLLEIGRDKENTEDLLTFDARLKEIFLLFLKIREISPVHSLFNRFNRILNETSFMDFVIQCVMILEGLISTSNFEVTFQFGIKLSLLLTQNYEKRVKLNKKFRNLYGLRSSIVHNNTNPSDKALKKFLIISSENPTTEELLKRTRREISILLNVVLLRLFLDEPSFHLHSERAVKNYLDEKILGKDENLSNSELFDKFGVLLLNSIKL